MIGASYYGVLQYLAAAQNPSHLVCTAPCDAFADPYRDVTYHGGYHQHGLSYLWHFDTRARLLLDQPGLHSPNMMQFDMVYAVLNNPMDGSLWWERAAYTKFDKIKIPVYSIGNWAIVGLHLRGNLLAYEEIQAPKKLLVNYGDPQKIFHSIDFHKELLRW